jgi:preprotein translocase subunit SecF
MFDFVGKRNYFFIISALILIAGIISYFVNGLQMDIQFEGGTLLQIEMNDGNFDVARAEEVFKEAVNKAASAQKLQTINAEDNKVIYMLQLRISSSETLTDDERNNVVDALRKEFNIKEDAAIEMQSVEPFIGAELKRNGIKAAVVASVLIVLYIWWRFRIMSGLSAAVSALIALIHDALVMFATYTLFQLPLNESFIAAILTILGYSINNTIVVYDRIRENRKLLKRATNTERQCRKVKQSYVKY